MTADSAAVDPVDDDHPVPPRRPGRRPASPTAIRRARLAGGVGTFIEYYDYSLYGFAAVLIAPHFFPSGDPTVSLLATLAVLATGYVARPVGGIFFGRLGDQRGRKLALVATVVTMGLASVVLGLLPTYAQIGVIAPVLLVLVRLVQGFAAGGEYGGAATYVAETAPTGTRGYSASFTLIGLVMGFAVGAAVTGVSALIVGSEAMAEWGWRIPFLFSLVLTAGALWARRRLEDTPEFTEMKEQQEVIRTPLRTALKEKPLEVAKVAGISFAMNGAGNIGLIYMSVYLINNAGFPAGEVYWLAATVIALSALTMPLAGKLSDRYGRRPIVAAGLIGFIVVSYPVMLVMATTESIFVAGLVYLLYMLPYAFLQTPVMPMFTEMFPRRFRLTGVALGFNIGSVVVGGTVPYLSAQITAWTGNQQASAFVVMICCGFGLLALWRIREGAKTELPV